MNYTIESKITEDEIKKLDERFIKNKNRGSKRIPSILRFRLEGKSLEFIATLFEVTRERIRQQEARGVEIIKHIT